MEMRGQYQISASRDAVWDALNDPEVLQACLEGCETFTRKSDTDFEAVINTKVGPIRTTFSCSLALSEINPPVSYTLSGQGNGGAAGYAKGSIKVELKEGSNTTDLSYTVDASLRGKIGQMGSRVIDSVAKSMADDFFDKLTRIVNERSGVSTDAPAPEESRRGFSLRAVAIAAVVGLIVLAIYFYLA